MELIEPLRRSWAVQLKTRKRDGSWVAYPVNLAVEGEESTAARSRLLDKYSLIHRFLVPLELKLKRTHDIRYELDGFRELSS